MVHKKRSGEAIVTWRCKTGVHDKCVEERFDSNLVCHCTSVDCAHPVECDGSCQKIKSRYPTNKFTGTSTESMGF